jgi:uncharacterized membrane protein
MSDTAPEAAALMRELLMRRTGAERLVMATAMFDAARALVIASLPPDLPPAEFKRRLFERIYGFPLPGAQDSAAAPTQFMSGEV